MDGEREGSSRRKRRYRERTWDAWTDMLMMVWNLMQLERILVMSTAG